MGSGSQGRLLPIDRVAADLEGNDSAVLDVEDRPQVALDHHCG